MQHGCDQHHALRQILQGDASGDGQRTGNVLRAEAYPCSKALWQIMDGHGRHEQQHPVTLGRALRRRARLKAGELLHPGGQPLQQQQKCRAAQNTRRGDENGPSPAALQRRQDQARHGGAEHDAGGKGQHGAAACPMGYAPEAIAAHRAQHGGAAHPQRGEENDQKHENTPFLWCEMACYFHSMRNKIRRCRPLDGTFL